MMPDDVDNDVLAAELEVLANILSDNEESNQDTQESKDKVIQFVYSQLIVLPLTWKLYGKNGHKIFASTLGKLAQSSVIEGQKICNVWPPKAGIVEIVKFGPPLLVDVNREKC
jgi:hypothetical protein